MNEIRYFKWFGEILEGKIDGDKFESNLDKMRYPISVSEKYSSCGLLTEAEIKEYLSKKKPE